MFFFLEEFTLSVTYDETQLLPSLCQLDKSELSWLKLGSDADEDLLSYFTQSDPLCRLLSGKGMSERYAVGPRSFQCQARFSVIFLFLVCCFVF